MAFNPLIDTPPTEYRGVSVKADFRQVLRFFKLMDDKRFSEQEKSLAIVRLFFDKLPEDAHDLWEFITWFVQCGDTKKQQYGGKRLFDFTIDAARVYAAYWQVYRVDLARVKMHWWTFMALFENLPNGTKLADVVEIRAKEIPRNADPKYRKEMQRLKNAFRIEEFNPQALRDMMR